MSIYTILFSGAGIGCIIGFCVGSYFCSMDVPIEPESDSDMAEYVEYLENMLDNSTTVTTESVQLQPIDTNHTNITAEFVYMTETIPSAPLQATIVEGDSRV